MRLPAENIKAAREVQLVDFLNTYRPGETVEGMSFRSAVMLLNEMELVPFQQARAATVESSRTHDFTLPHPDKNAQAATAYLMHRGIGPKVLRYAFPNQALIYSQRPGATMLADSDTWNRAAGRWVNRGAHGVASLGTGHMAGNVRYLFNIKDTHPDGKGAKPLGWQITDANRYPTLQALQEKHNAESLPEIFGLQAALFVA